VKQEDSLDPPLERFLLRNGSQTTERGLSEKLIVGLGGVHVTGHRLLLPTVVL
jgi:hypothetical protein